MEFCFLLIIWKGKIMELCISRANEYNREKMHGEEKEIPISKNYYTLFVSRNGIFWAKRIKFIRLT